MKNYKILQYDANEQKLKSIPFQAENNAQAVEKAKYIHLDEACTAAEIVIISGGVPTHVKFIKNGTLTIEQAAEFVGRSLPTIYHKWPQMNGRREGKNLYFDREQLCNYITARDSRKINAISAQNKPFKTLKTKNNVSGGGVEAATIKLTTMESTLIWHKPSEPVTAGVEVIIIYRGDESFELTNYKWMMSGIKSNFAGKQIVAWAECKVKRIAEIMMENFDKQWIDFLHKNATK